MLQIFLRQLESTLEVNVEQPHAHGFLLLAAPSAGPRGRVKGCM